MQQVLCRIPLYTSWTPNGIPVYGFGVMLCIAFLVCWQLTVRRAERESVTRETIGDLAWWLLVGGLLGARITYLTAEQPPDSVGEFFAQLPRIWDGGIVLYGAVLGGLAAFGVFYWASLRRRGYTVLQLGDIIAPAVALGVGLGRVGCFLNGCCYGQVVCTCCAYPVHFPLPAPPRYALTESGYQTAAGFTFDPDQASGGARIGRVEPGSAAAQAGLKGGDVIARADGHPILHDQDLSVYLREGWPRGKNDLTLGVGVESLHFRPETLGLHPTQLYETISMGLLFLVLTAFYPLRTRRGQVLALLMIGYAVHRSLNELLRGDPRPVGFEAVSSIVLLAGGGLLLVYLARRPADFRLVRAA